MKRIARTLAILVALTFIFSQGITSPSAAADEPTSDAADEIPSWWLPDYPAEGPWSEAWDWCYEYLFPEPEPVEPVEPVADPLPEPEPIEEPWYPAVGPWSEMWDWLYEWWYDIEPVEIPPAEVTPGDPSTMIPEEPDPFECWPEPTPI